MNNNQNINNDIAAALNNIARELHSLRGSGLRNNYTRVTDYARNYRQQANIALPNTTIGGAGSLTNQLWGDSTNSFNKMTLGLLPAIKNNFLDPFKKIWGDRSTGFLGKLSSSFINIFTGAFRIINDILGNIYSYFKNAFTQAYRQFLQIQKVIGGIAADIGLSKSESKGLLLNFTELAVTAMEFGGSIEDIGTMLSSFTATTGKNRIFDAEEVKNIEKLGLGTALGIQGMTQLVGEFNNLGISMSKAFALTEKARIGAAKLGLNSDRVLKSYVSLVNGLTGFQMKSGLDNMIKLATQATQLRMELSDVAQTMSSSFFEPEGAVEAAAKMQVLGGQFAEKFGDAFELLYKAQVSPEMFQKDLMDMVKGLAIKGENGLFYVPPQQMRMLQETAKILGVQYNDLLNGAIEQGKLADKFNVLSQKGIFFRNQEDRMAIANLIDFSEEKNGYILRMPDGEKKLLSELTNQSQFNNILAQKKADEDAAKKRMNFTERLSNVFARFQMNFTQVFAQIFDKLEESGFMNQLDEFMTSLSKQIIPAIKNLFSDKGTLSQIMTDVFEKIKSIVKGLTDIWNGEAGFWDKIKDSVAKLVIDTWRIVEPYLSIGFGKLLMAIGKATGFDTVTGWGEKMMLDVAKENSNNELIKKLTGTKQEKEKYLSDIRGRENEISPKQWALIAGITGIAAALAPVTLGGSLAVGGAALSTFGLSKMYNEYNSEDYGKKYGDINKLSPVETVQDAVITSNGRVFKGSKGDAAILLNEAAIRNNNTNATPTEIKHSGTIVVKSEDGKQITISDLEKIGRYTLAQYIDSINHGLKNGTAVYNNEKMPITPIGS